MDNYSKYDAILISVGVLIGLMLIGIAIAQHLTFVAGIIALAIVVFGLFVVPPTDVISLE